MLGPSGRKQREQPSAGADYALQGRDACFFCGPLVSCAVPCLIGGSRHRGLRRAARKVTKFTNLITTGSTCRVTDARSRAALDERA